MCKQYTYIIVVLVAMKLQGIRKDVNGWIYLSVHGGPHQRGFAHGHLVAHELTQIMEMLEFFLYEEYGRTFAFFCEMSDDFFRPQIEAHFPEFYEEMCGIAEGSKQPLQKIVFWNCFVSFDYMFSHLSDVLNEPHNAHLRSKSIYADFVNENGTKKGSGGLEGGAKDRCSAFIAVGDYTTDGKIVCAHNSFDNYINGQYSCVIMDLRPSSGHRILMQSFPGGIHSGTDVFVTSQGLFGTETTMGGFHAYENNDPVCCRIRRAMQYGNSMDDYVAMLTERNSGDYANAWLFGDTRTNEIMRLELGLKYVDVKRTKNGYFVGFNVAFDARIRNIESSNTGWDDIRRHQGSRRVRLHQMMEEHKGRLDVETAKLLIGDHYDVYLNKINPCSRTTCSHYDLDAREFMSQADRPKPFQPRGAVDGMAIDTATAQRMQLWGRWGSSCGTGFYKDTFCDRNMIWNTYRPYLHDRPPQPWTLFGLNKSYHAHSAAHKHTRKHRHHPALQTRRHVA
jgi:hypothetical protein